MPVSISVTGCSTWIRQLISMKYGVAVAIDEELEGADALVAGRDDGPDGPRAEVRPDGRRQCRRGTLLEDLLVAPLDGAVALAEMDARAEPVDRDLDLDVAVLVEPRLEVQGVVAEGGLAPPTGRPATPPRARATSGPSACPCRRRRRRA